MWPRHPPRREPKTESVRPDTRRRGAALAAGADQAEAPELQLVHLLLTGGERVGLLVEGLHRVGYDVHLAQYGDNTFCATF